MIGSLTGVVQERYEDFVLLDVGGVGYIVHCSERTMASLPKDGSIIRIFTDLYVREDILQLFGFRTRKECELHRLLISVQGVGTRAALAIAGTLGADGSINAITLKDSDAIRTAKGVGPKLAVRIVNELQEKVSALIAWSEEEIEIPDSEIQEDKSKPKINANKQIRSVETPASVEAHSALINLGYQQGEASRTIAEVMRDNQDLNTEDLIRQCLIKLTPG